ncbi:MAG: 50S ribosomal protein L30 [Proteobacteria bacterium]|nr:50S ribosomal protein L30 [Pseudomonadota bacterium]
MNINKLKVTQIKSKYGRLLKHIECLRGLGIKKINKTITIDDTPENRGMLSKIYYMLKVEESSDVS